MAPPEPLSQTEIDARLAELPGWTQQGDLLARRYQLRSHFAAATLVLHIAQTQDELDHHADVTLGYHSVDLTVNTHSVGGKITKFDFRLAERVEALASAHGVR